MLTYAYQRRLDEGWSTWAFFRTRAIRLYPLYALGLALGFAFAVLQSHFGKVHLGALDALKLLGLALFLLPCPPRLQVYGPALFPLLVPAWSLFYEIAMNLLHALLLRRGAWRFLPVVTLGSLAVWVAAARSYGGMGFGVETSSIGLGFVRVAFSYSLGCLLFRLWIRSSRRFRLPPSLCGLALLAALFAPLASPLPTLVDFAIVGLLFPAILMAGASAASGPRMTRVAEVLGTSSYAIYVLHAPVGLFFEQAWRLALHRTMEAVAPWSGLIYVVLLFLLAVWLDRVYDVPARQWLRRRLA